MLAISLADRSISCFLGSTPLASDYCYGYGTYYLSHKYLDRDIEDGGEFACPACIARDEALQAAEYEIWCRDLGLEPYPDGLRLRSII